MFLLASQKTFSSALLIQKATIFGNSSGCLNKIKNWWPSWFLTISFSWEQQNMEKNMFNTTQKPTMPTWSTLTPRVLSSCCKKTTFLWEKSRKTTRVSAMIKTWWRRQQKIQARAQGKWSSQGYLLKSKWLCTFYSIWMRISTTTSSTMLLHCLILSESSWMILNIK